MGSVLVLDEAVPENYTSWKFHTWKDSPESVTDSGQNEEEKQTDVEANLQKSRSVITKTLFEQILKF